MESSTDFTLITNRFLIPIILILLGGLCWLFRIYLGARVKKRGKLDAQITFDKKKVKIRLQTDVHQLLQELSQRVDSILNDNTYNDAEKAKLIRHYFNDFSSKIRRLTNLLDSPLATLKSIITIPIAAEDISTRQNILAFKQMLTKIREDRRYG